MLTVGDFALALAIIPLHPILDLWSRFFSRNEEPAEEGAPERRPNSSRNHSGYPAANGHPYEIWQPPQSAYEDDQVAAPAYAPSKYPGPPTPPPDYPPNLPLGISSPGPGFSSPGPDFSSHGPGVYNDPWRRDLNMPSAFPHTPLPTMGRLHSAPAHPYPPLIVEDGPAPGAHDPARPPLDFRQSLQ